MAKADLYTIKGVKKEAVSLPKEFGEEVNMALLAQAVRVYEDNSHVGLPKSKTRAEVDRTTKKVYKQKGTGGARHGSRRAPIYVGGGTAHGPTGEKRALGLPKKMARKALNSALSLAASKGQVVVIEGIDSFKKTKEAASLFDKIGIKKGIVALSGSNLKVGRMVGNIENIRVLGFKDLNAYDMFLFENLILDGNILEKEKPAKKTVARKETK